jgi:hypothetical protein
VPVADLVKLDMVMFSGGCPLKIIGVYYIVGFLQILQGNSIPRGYPRFTGRDSLYSGGY